MIERGNNMLVEEFIKILENEENKNMVLELKGIIETKIEIKQIEIKEKDKYLTIVSKETNNIKENKKQKIVINLHQLMKITKLKENEFLLEFDQLQEIKIKLFQN